MIKILDEQKRASEISAAAIPFGETFTGTLSGFTGVFVKTAVGIMLLSEKLMIWGFGDFTYTNMCVRNYVPVDLEIKVVAR